jgi:hypothetical protein
MIFNALFFYAAKVLPKLGFNNTDLSVFFTKYAHLETLVSGT